jgi:hypothetical protein
MVDQSVKCGECEAVLAEVPNGAHEPCPRCGSKKRTHFVGVSESIEVHERLSGKVKDVQKAGKNKTRAEFVTGDDLHRASRRWNKLDREIDRENDRYREKIVDPQTGAVIRSVDEPLSEHQGHGSAKKGE